jgi:hypothetical protein
MTVARPLTDTQLRRLRVTGERYELPDPGLPGLALRISSKGQKTWTVVYRVRGSGEAGERVARLAGAKRRLTLGEYPAVGLAEARAKAAEVKRLARSGVDTSAAGHPGRQSVERTDRRRLDRPLRGRPLAPERIPGWFERGEAAAAARRWCLEHPAGRVDHANGPCPAAGEGPHPVRGPVAPR